jgi:hypothetical protein
MFMIHMVDMKLQQNVGANTEVQLHVLLLATHWWATIRAPLYT